jgi:hypothetical protein
MFSNFLRMPLYGQRDVVDYADNLYSARRMLPSIIFPIAIPQYPGADFFPGNTDPEDMKS